MDTYYNNLNHELDKLQNMQHGKNKAQHNAQRQQFYPTTVNLTKSSLPKRK